MNWIGRLVRRGRMERELDAELRFHFETLVAERMQRGMTETEARRSARLDFGGMDQVKEDCRESRGTLWVESIAQDLRFGARILARSPGFSATAILVLALGIGVSTLAFSLYNLIALQSLPVRDPQSLVGMQRRSPENIAPNLPYASITYYGDNAKSLSAVMATMTAMPMLMDRDEQRITPGFVTANYFSELGAAAAAGRLFMPDRESSSDSPPAVVLSYRFWQRRFNGDPAVVGRVVHLSGKAATVVGVASKSFANLGVDDPDLWLPLAQYSYFVEGSRPLDDPKFDGLIMMWGRLAPGFTASTAQQELLALTDQLRKLYPAMIWDNERIVVTPGAHFFTSEDSGPILAFVAVLVLLILGIACANLGGLLMARGASRQREIRLRFELGARRFRVFRQLLTENFLLGFLGAVAALPLSYVALRLTLTYANAPSWMSAVPDWRVLVFTAAMGFLAAMFFGFLPTVQMVRHKTNRTLWHQFVVCAQVGASCVLLILAGLLVRATLHTLYTNPGFGYEQVYSIDPGLHDHGYNAATAQTYLDQMQERLRAVPGVASVSVALNPPLVSKEVMITSIDVNGKRVLIYPNWVGPEFFQTMQIPLLRGRLIQPGENNAVMLSESLARQRWPNEDPIGKPWKNTKNVVVGVVGNTRAMELNNTDATELYYPPAAEHLASMSVLVRVAGDPANVLPAIKSVAAEGDTKLFPTITPLSAGFRKNVAVVEQVATIISLLGGIAIFLAVVGLLGLVSYAVSQRTREIAIRLALGAHRAEIFSAVLRRFAWPVAIGLIAGVGVTAGLSQVLRRGLYGISGLDPISYAGAIACLLAILMGAALLPLRRALRIDIARILHAE
ncbi:ABC efflux pump, inner membrane subunit [Candidatus Koribacter versatilis Ellin345]|uniref:ABC efflux pump, inner membrane subunit n=1 Tax=Koribacter versatilis (strain Ellin345) TaxID=204669 RepID=Q1IMK3_KORVE|nr:ABC transporter permease [Candidatus Koribacter versatilis]ABF41897.1 ABC efflux pump, inner membrane subunit [Candidatus Koribacter versatilis Ellin345]